MLAENLISDTLPVLHPSDTGQQALNWMDLYRVSHLPVVKEKEYLGLISDKFIYDLNLAEVPVETQIMQLHTPHIHSKQHIFEVASVMYTLGITVLPVVDQEHSFLGSVTLYGISFRFAQLLSLQEPGGILILQTTLNNYSASQISRIVEENDAHILSLLVNRIDGSDNLEITIKLDIVDLSSVIQTFTRHDYQIAAAYMDDSMLHDLYEDRMEQFFRYLNI